MTLVSRDMEAALCVRGRPLVVLPYKTVLDVPRGAPASCVVIALDDQRNNLLFQLRKLLGPLLCLGRYQMGHATAVALPSGEGTRKYDSLSCEQRIGRTSQTLPIVSLLPESYVGHIFNFF